MTHNKLKEPVVMYRGWKRMEDSGKTYEVLASQPRKDRFHQTCTSRTRESEQASHYVLAIPTATSRFASEIDPGMKMGVDA